MKLIDITNDSEAIYRIAENERVVFVMENRVDDLTFELAGRNAEAHVFSLLSGHDDDAFEPKVIIRHLAPDTKSSVSVRARLDDRSSLRFRGCVEIAQTAVRTEAREDVRALLLSPEARASAAPELEIGTDEVVCTHAAVIAPPDRDQIIYLATRGLSEKQAADLLAEGFFKEMRKEIALKANDM